MRFFVFCACLAVSACGVFEGPEVHRLRQAADPDGGFDGGYSAPDASAIGLCVNELDCAAGNSCVMGQCTCPGGTAACPAGTYCQADGSCAASTDGGNPTSDAGTASRCFGIGGTDLECDGLPGMQLGWSVSLCGGRSFAAGAPGHSAVLTWANNTLEWLLVANPTEHAGEAVLCRPSAATLVAGPTGLFETSGAGTENLWDLPTTALAPLTELLQAGQSPLAVSENQNGDHVVLRQTINGLTEAFHDSAPFTTLATSPDGLAPAAVVSVPETTGGTVFALKRSATGGIGFEVDKSSSNLSSFTNVGVALAVGNVWPDRDLSAKPTNEVLVATDSYVVILRGDLEFVKKIPLNAAIGSNAGPPVSLAVDEAPLTAGSPIHAFFIGNPKTNQVLRCVGTRCTPWKTGPEKSDFGASIAQKEGSLLVGAPSALDGGGAVFLYSRVQPNLMGELQECTENTSCCTSNAVLGTCVGGVFCQTTSTQVADECLAQDAGTLDAGVKDAGALDDAGTSDDAGTAKDAGWSDGGAGGGAGGEEAPANFVTRGCSSTPVAWVLLAALLAWRRGRSTQSLKEP